MGGGEGGDTCVCVYTYMTGRASLVPRTLQNLPAVQETWVPSLVREDLLEKGMATHSSIPAWRIPWMEESAGLQSVGLPRVKHDRACTHILNYII